MSILYTISLNHAPIYSCVGVGGDFRMTFLAFPLLPHGLGAMYMHVHSERNLVKKSYGKF